VSTRQADSDQATSGVNIKAGVEIIQKSVVHIDNLDSDCTFALLKDYLLANDIPVLSCFST